ncbi:MAG: HAD family hydrolase [Spirochaetes bacterium]|nr:HAD family hydrolase [Spirochaetota bacterium]
MNHRAALFDMDGTLLDTLRDIAGSMNAVLGARGLPGHPVERYRDFVGDGMENLVRRVLPPGPHDEATVRAMVGEMRSEYAWRWDRTTRLYPGMDRLLDALRGRGMPLAILSNKPDDFTREMAARFLGRWEFAVVAGMREGVPIKPDPAAALEIAQTMRIEPGEFIYLGDTGTDMRTAVRAGMFPVGVLWGFRGEKELRDNGARVLLESPPDMLDLLDAKGG